MREDFELTVGLEVHAELRTKTKIFCGCKNVFGAKPNTVCCPVCMGYPGVLPVLNKKVVEYGIRAGVATNCSISEITCFARKNYFYPDLPKGYQISQSENPLCFGGWIELDGKGKVGITRIHIEEDAGKLTHTESGESLIDCNRCGVPLIEIVSEPDIHSPEDAVLYLKRLREILLYSGVSDCKMNEGSLRCDVNLSVRRKGDLSLGTRCEIKNLNSFSFVQKAVEYECERQISVLENGNNVVCETRRFDEKTGQTYAMRSKEVAEDYRYFPEPDLISLKIEKDYVKKIRESLPTLPSVRRDVYRRNYSLSDFDADMLTENIKISDYFEKTAVLTRYPKILANLIISECFRIMADEIRIAPENLALCADMAGDGYINSGTAKKLVGILWDTDLNPKEYVDENGLCQINDEEFLKGKVFEAISENSKIIEDFKNGKQSSAKALMGKIMAKTRGQGNPKIVKKLLDKALSAL